jgi:hypothetical protein
MFCSSAFARLALAVIRVRRRHPLAKHVFAQTSSLLKLDVFGNLRLALLPRSPAQEFQKSKGPRATDVTRRKPLVHGDDLQLYQEWELGIETWWPAADPGRARACSRPALPFPCPCALRHEDSEQRRISQLPRGIARSCMTVRKRGPRPPTATVLTVNRRTHPPAGRPKIYCNLGLFTA